MPNKLNYCEFVTHKYLNWFEEVKQMRENNKKSLQSNNREQITESFMFQPPIYDIVPPEPISYPRTCHYTLQPDRHYSHKFSALFLSNIKPLLIGCDVGIPVEQLILFSNQYNKHQNQLDLEDQMLLREVLPASFEKHNNKKSTHQTSTQFHE